MDFSFPSFRDFYFFPSPLLTLVYPLGQEILIQLLWVGAPALVSNCSLDDCYIHTDLRYTVVSYKRIRFILEPVSIQHIELLCAVEFLVNYFVHDKLRLLRSRVYQCPVWLFYEKQHVPPLPGFLGTCGGLLHRHLPCPSPYPTASLGPGEPVGVTGSLFQGQNSRPLSQTY